MIISVRISSPALLNGIRLVGPLATSFCYFRHVVERLCACIAGAATSIIVPVLKQVVFTAIKSGKFESVPTASELQAANLGVLQVTVGEARDTLMNPSPICYERISDLIFLGVVNNCVIYFTSL